MPQVVCDCFVNSLLQILIRKLVTCSCHCHIVLMKLWSQIVSSSLVASESYHSRIIGLTVYLLNCLDFLWCLLFHVCWWCSTFPYALALCYSAAVYCAPVWSCSAHTSQVDVQLNSTMRLISGTLRSTPLPWLPVLSNIEPPALRRKAATDKMVEKIVKHESWPIQPDILSPPLLQLTSKKPLWLDLKPVAIDGGITESRLRWSILT